MSAGRPLSSWCFPRVWKHVESLGFARSERALIALRHSGFTPPNGTRLSNNFFGTKFRPEEPRLYDYSTAHDVVELINFHREKKKKGTLEPAKEIVQFCFRVIPTGTVVTLREGHMGDFAGSLSASSGLPEEVIAAALSNRLLPQLVCEILVKTTNGLLKMEQTRPGRGAAPVSDSTVIRHIIKLFEAA